MSKLTKKFASSAGELIAVDDLSFTIKPGEVFALIGPNGAGKTTTLKVIVGLYRKTGGEISLFNHDLANSNIKLKSQIGYIPDEPIFYPYLTAREFLKFNRLLYEIDEKTYSQRLKKLLEIFPIDDLLDFLPDQFSRGNKQKLSIISVLLHNPKLLVVDEPIVGLDPQSSQATIATFRDFAKKGGMILVSTHTLSFVEQIAHSVALIHHSKLVFQGSLTDITYKVKGANNLTQAFISMTSS